MIKIYARPLKSTTCFKRAVRQVTSFLDRYSLEYQVIKAWPDDIVAEANTRGLLPPVKKLPVCIVVDDTTNKWATTRDEGLRTFIPRQNRQVYRLQCLLQAGL